MRTWFIRAVIAAVGLLLWGAAPANAATSPDYTQDFSAGTSGWFDFGTGSIVWNGTEKNATAVGGDTGPFTRFDTFRDEWPGDYRAQLDVYLDPAWAEGTGFDYSVAANGTDNAHERDFIFHLGVDAEGLWVYADNNSSSSITKNPAAVTLSAGKAGWYTMRHDFTDDNGVLSVTMTLLDAKGKQLYTRTLSNPADTIGAGGAVGGNRYGWFTVITVAGGVTIDNTRLALLPVAPASAQECKKGGYATLGFDNQGRCVSSVTANGKARS